MGWIARVRRAIEQFAVDALLLGVGSMATFLSVKWTYNWQVYTGDPPFEGLGFSLVVVLFAVLIFEFAVQEAMNRRRRAIAFFVMWAIVAFYSMQTTVAGQYIGVKRNELARLEASMDEKTAEVQVMAIEEQMGILVAEEESYKKRQMQLLEILEKIDSVEKRFEWKKNVEATELELKGVNDRLRKLSEDRIALGLEARKYKGLAKVEELKGSGENVFAFYSEVLGIDNISLVEFVLAVFRGVILDTINILCFMFVMLRRSRKEDSLVTFRPERIQEPEGVAGIDIGPAAGVLPTDGGDDDLEEAAAHEERESVDALEVLATDSYSPGRRNGTFTSRARARRLGVKGEDYDRIVRRALGRGTLVRRGGMICKNEYYGKEDFLRECLTGE